MSRLPTCQGYQITTCPRAAAVGGAAVRFAVAVARARGHVGDEDVLAVKHAG